MTLTAPPTITFDLKDEQAIAIIKRAAAALHLRVLTWPDGSFTVGLSDPLDAYYLGDQCTKDPAWAGLFARGTR